LEKGRQTLAAFVGLEVVLNVLRFLDYSHRQKSTNSEYSVLAVHRQVRNSARCIGRVNANQLAVSTHLSRFRIRCIIRVRHKLLQGNLCWKLDEGYQISSRFLTFKRSDTATA